MYIYIYMHRSDQKVQTFLTSLSLNEKEFFMVLKDNSEGNWLFPQYNPINLQIIHNIKLHFLDLSFIYLIP